MFDTETMRKRFHELGRAREELLRQTAPKEQALDALRREEAAIAARVKAAAADLKTARAPLFSIDDERATISRVLKGKTGEPA